jgi:hypothetical protein
VLSLAVCGIHFTRSTHLPSQIPRSCKSLAPRSFPKNLTTLHSTWKVKQEKKAHPMQFQTNFIHSSIYSTTLPGQSSLVLYSRKNGKEDLHEWGGTGTTQCQQANVESGYSGIGGISHPARLVHARGLKKRKRTAAAAAHLSLMGGVGGRRY